MSPSPIPNDPILAMVPEFRGRRILHPCVLYARLGRGGMGAVYLGKHLTLRQRQVVKCLWLMGHGTGSGADDEFVDRFHQEARIAAEMTHQNLVRVTHVDRYGELHYLVMEHIDGEDANRRVRRRGALREDEALVLLYGAAQGLGYAHVRGIVHRDIKPANLMISTRGEVKVIDLGLAKALDARQDLTATHGMLGTPRYMAPEQWTTTRVGPEADVWALGATMYFLLTGDSLVPAGCETPTAIQRFVCEHDFRLDGGLPPDVCKQTRRILERCVARDPAQRYQTARELAADLGAELARRRIDDHLLADPAAAPEVPGDEPGDAELRQLQQELSGQGERGRARNGAARAPRAEDDRTVPLQQLGPPDPLAGGATLATMPGIAMPTPTPAHTPGGTAPAVPTAAAADAAPKTRGRRGLRVAIAAATVAVLGSTGFVLFGRVDPAALQNDAMAAIYQERYRAADRLLTRLEQFPAFADQARRLRVDALVKEAARVERDQPLDALAQLAAAQDVATQLLLPKDIDDANARIRAPKERIEAALRARLAAGCAVLEPAAGATITASTTPLVLRAEVAGLDVHALVDDRPVAGAGPVLRTQWQAPASDGEHALEVAFVEAKTGLRHVVTVPVLVKLGAVGLQLDAPPASLRADRCELRGLVTNGPVDITLELEAPNGEIRRQPLGAHDGAFACAAEFPAGVDGEFRVRVRGKARDREVVSADRQLLVDRAAPRLAFAQTTVRTAAASLMLRGTADEPCRVFVSDHPGQDVPTDGDRAFVLPLPLTTRDGVERFAITARDATGNEAQPVILEVLVDRTAPTFATAPACEPAARGAQVEVRGRLGEPGFVWSNEEAAVATGADGTFTLAVDLVPGEVEQPTTLRIGARDLAGNRAAAAGVAVFVDRRGPTILPGAPDGSWSARGRWMLRVEDGSRPCRVTAGGETLAVDEQGRVEFAMRALGDALEVVAEDRLGNRTTRRLAAAAGGAGAGPAGPTWGAPVPGTVLDAETHLYERVTVAIGERTLTLRLVRQLHDDELPPLARRDAKAAVLPRGPFYLAETEVAVADWAQFVAAHGESAAATERFVFDPDTGRTAPRAGAGWRAPVHPSLQPAAGELQTWPVTQVTPEEARAFCAAYGLRLPDEAEWLYVCRMGTRARYGWGTGGGALEGRANLADLALQAKARGLRSYETFADGYAALAPVDALPLADHAHPWGFRGLLGNAAEWCGTQQGRVVARGGSWLSEPRDLRVDQLRLDGLITSGAWDSVGFRVARDP